MAPPTPRLKLLHSTARFATASPRSATGDRRYLLYLSRIHEKKGCDLLIAAFARVAAEMPDVDLVIAGPDRTELRPRLEAQAAQLGIASRIHWPGMVLGDAKWGAFRGCDAFILPSHQENFGIVVAEAMACARPVLVSTRVNIWDEVVRGGGGLAEPDTIDGTEALIRAFYKMSEPERAAMGAKARETYLAHFEGQRVASDLIAHLERIVAEGR